MDILKGSTDKSVYVRIINATTGIPDQSIVYNTSGLVIWYRREGGTVQNLTLTSLSALSDAHTDGGFLHVDDGLYRVDLPDAAYATGSGHVLVGGACTGMIVIETFIQLVNYNPEDGVRMGLTALPNAAADSAGGIPISDAGGLDIDTILGRIDAAISSRSSHSAADVWTVATRTLTSFGTLVSDIATAVWGATTRTLSAFGFSVTVGTNNDKTGYTVSTVSDKTGYSISGTKQTLDALNDVSASTVRTQADNALTAYDPPTKAELDSAVSPLATSSALSIVAGYVDTEVAAIKAVTDKIDTALVLDGAVYQFTTNALENAPSSSGGDATAANQTIIINHLTGIKGATFDTSTDSLEAIRDRGDAAWVTGGGLSGSNTALVTVQDGSGNNIVDAYVDIFDSGNTSFQQRFITNSSGQVSFTINDGTWYIRISKSGYTFTAVSFTVSGNYTHTYNMTPYVITPPTSPDLCRVYTYVYKPDGTFHTTLSGIATIGIYTEDNQYYTYQSTAVYNNTTGLIYWDIIQGANAVLTITELEYFTKSILVPSLTTSELSDL